MVKVGDGVRYYKLGADIAFYALVTHVYDDDCVDLIYVSESGDNVGMGAVRRSEGTGHWWVRLEGWSYEANDKDKNTAGKMDKPVKEEIDYYIDQRKTLAVCTLAEYIKHELLALDYKIDDEVAAYIRAQAENVVCKEFRDCAELLADKKDERLQARLEDTRPESNGDNWKRRSSKMTCSTCMWYVPKKNSKGESKLGRCRRHAHDGSGWSVQFPGDWCGDHKIDENKI